MTMSTICYHAFWPCPFTSKTMTSGSSIPKHIYAQGDEESQELLISH